MKRNEAIKRAIKLSKRNDETLFVVYDPTYDESGNDFHVADENELMDFFFGAPVIFATDE